MQNIQQNKEVELNDPTDLQPMVYVQERKVQGDSARYYQTMLILMRCLLSATTHLGPPHMKKALL